jgi:hypothetical protein
MASLSQKKRKKIRRELFHKSNITNLFKVEIHLKID